MTAKRFEFREATLKGMKLPYVYDKSIQDYLNPLMCVDLLNELHEENQELKEDNDIKFWKHELMIQWNTTQIISHELSLAIENGYEISEDFKKYLDELKERHEEHMKKAERLKI